MIKCANASTSEETVARMDSGAQDEAVKKHSFPNVSRKLFNDSVDSAEQNCCLTLIKASNEL